MRSFQQYSTIGATSTLSSKASRRDHWYAVQRQLRLIHRRLYRPSLKALTHQLQKLTYPLLTDLRPLARLAYLEEAEEEWDLGAETFPAFFP